MTKKETSRVEKALQDVEKHKEQQDYLLDRIEEQILSLKERIRLDEEQIVMQEKEKESLRQALRGAISA